MTKEDIIRMAREADLWGEIYAMQRFANLVAAAEREACAKTAEERWLDKANCTAEEMYEMQKKSIAEAIRARGRSEALTNLNKAAEDMGEEL